MITNSLTFCISGSHHSYGPIAKPPLLNFSSMQLICFSIVFPSHHILYILFLSCNFIFSLLYFLTAHLLTATLICSPYSLSLSLSFLQVNCAFANFLCLGCSSSSSHFTSVSNTNHRCLEDLRSLRTKLRWTEPEITE